MSGSPASSIACVELLELGEHRLPVDRAADVVDLPVDQVRAHRAVVRLREQMMREQLLVERAGDLREEDRVVVVWKGCARCAYQVCIEWPASCASVKTSVKTSCLVVHQDVTAGCRNSRAERAAALALAFVAVAPALARKPVARAPAVFVAERRERRETLLDRLVPRRRASSIVRHDRHVGVVVVDVGELQHALAQLRSSGTAAARFARTVRDEVVVDRHRHVVVKERGLARARSNSRARARKTSALTEFASVEASVNL